MNTIFQVILNMSITASIVILVVLLARLCLKQAPKVFSYALWAVVLFRLLCPISLSSDFSIINFFGAPTTNIGQIEYVSLNTDDSGSPKLTITAPAADFEKTTVPSLENETQPTDTFELSVSVLSTIWICGIAVMIAFNIIQLIRLSRNLICAAPLYDNIYIADHIPTPFVYGVIHPKIYLPSEMSETEQSYIIQHEKHHIRRGDHVVKLLAFLAICIHWFNPLVWVAFALSSKDMEMSCDEAVIKQIDKDIRADYSNSLLQFSTGKKIILGTPLAFGEGETKERIKNIMKYKKPTFIIVISALALCLGLTVCLFSNPRTNAEEPNPNGSIINDDDKNPPVSDDKNPPVSNNDIYPLQGGFANEDMLKDGNYHEFITENSEYTVKLFFKANEALTDIRFSLLEYGDSGTLNVAKELYTLPKLTPDKPLVTGVVFYGSMTTYGISFTDSNGQTHRYAIQTSGKDGSLLMNEY